MNEQLQISDKDIKVGVEFFDKVAHRDAIQLIPYDRQNPENRMSQFLGDIMQHVSVKDNDIQSTAALQGIFSTDGAYINLSIKNNTLDVGGKHVISINGLLSGEILENKDAKGAPLSTDKITLYPLRIGGERNHLIIGFNSDNKNTQYNYQTIKGQAHTDLRTTPKANSINWIEVDMDQFRKEVRSLADRKVNPVSYRALIGNRNNDGLLTNLLFDSGGRQVLSQYDLKAGDKHQAELEVEHAIPEWEAGFENFNVTTDYVLDKDVDEPQSRTGYFSEKSEFSTASGFSKPTDEPENETNTKSTDSKTSGSGNNHGSDTPETYGNNFDSAPDSTPVSHEDSFFSGSFQDK